MTHQPPREPPREPGASDGGDGELEGDTTVVLEAGDHARLRAGVVTRGRF